MIGKNIKNVLLFTAGLVMGSVVTWKMTKDKYEQWANDEIRMMREYYNQKEEEYYEEEDLDEEPIEAEVRTEKSTKPDLTEYTSRLNESGYTDYSEISKKDEEEDNESDMEEKPYVISPEEFGDFDDYETIELTYYKNGYVTDDQDILMSNDEVEEAIGWNNITRMGEYEEDALHVRNEKRKTDYEILQVFDDYRED